MESLGGILLLCHQYFNVNYDRNDPILSDVRAGSQHSFTDIGGIATAGAVGTAGLCTDPGLSIPEEVSLGTEQVQSVPQTDRAHVPSKGPDRT